MSFLQLPGGLYVHDPSSTGAGGQKLDTNFTKLDAGLTADLTHVQPGVGIVQQWSGTTSANLAAAKAAAIAGDLIVVGPGLWVTEAGLAKDGVNWYFHGSTVQAGEGITIFDDGGVAMAFSVFGSADFSSTADSAGHVLHVANADSVVNFNCATAINITTTGGGINAAVILQQNGKLTLKANRLTSTYSPVWWTNGDFFLTADVIEGGDQPALYLATTGTQVGQFYCTANRISTTGGTTIELSGSSDARAWIDAKVIQTATGIAIACVGDSTGPFLYVRAQKILNTAFSDANGQSVYSSGVLYLTVQKISTFDSTTADRGSIHLVGGKSFIRCDQFDDTNGLSPKGAVYVTDGVHQLEVQTMFLATAAATCIQSDGGDITLITGRLAAGAGGTDLVQVGGVLSVLCGHGSGADGSFTAGGTITYVNAGVLADAIASI